MSDILKAQSRDYLSQRPRAFSGTAAFRGASSDSTEQIPYARSMSTSPSILLCTYELGASELL